MPTLIKKQVDELSYRIYVTSMLQCVAENTAIPAAYFTEGKSGKYIERKWYEPKTDQRVPEHTDPEEAAEEIIDRMCRKLKGG